MQNLRRILILLVLLPYSYIGAQSSIEQARLIANISEHERSFRDERGFVAPMFFLDGNEILIPVGEKSEYLRFDSRFQILGVSKTTSYQTRFGESWTCFRGMYYGYGSGISIASAKGEPYFYNLELRVRGEVGLFEDLVLVVDNRGGISGIVLPKTEKESPEYLSNEMVKKYIEDRGRSYGLSIEGGYVLYKGVPWYSEAFEGKWGVRSLGLYSAIDKDRNIYFLQEVRSAAGEVVKSFSFNSDTGELLVDQVSYDYEGNVYLLKKGKVFYIGRDWGYPDAKKGTVDVDSSPLKLHPGAGELTVSTARPGPVTVFEKTLQTETISGKSAAWYKVKLADGIVGWLHGSALAVPADASLKIFDSPVLGKK